MPSWATRDCSKQFGPGVSSPAWRPGLAATRQENSRLREQVRRLKEDPASVEAIAREELGLIRPGEMLFIVHDIDGKKK